MDLDRSICLPEFSIAFLIIPDKNWFWTISKHYVDILRENLIFTITAHNDS